MRNMKLIMATILGIVVVGNFVYEFGISLIDKILRGCNEHIQS